MASKMTATEKKIATAFRAMRKDGLLARQAFKSNADAAWKAMLELVRVSAPTAKLTGAVSYSRDAWRDAEDGSDLMIHFTSVKSDSSLGTCAVGALAVKHLLAAGLEVSWSVSPAVCIAVKLA
jgi:hypothetical protein